MPQLTLEKSPDAMQTGNHRSGSHRKIFQPHSVFLILASAFGLLVMVANPPFQAGDESEHFVRAFQISEGTIVGRKGFGNTGGDLPIIAFRVGDPEGISFHYEKKMTQAIFLKKLDPLFVDWKKAARTFCGFPHSVVYPPAGYLPQTLAIFLGRHAHIGPLGLMYLARLAGLIASIALAYAALRNLPVYRWSAMLLLLSPMSLYLFGSVAPDGFLISGTFLLVALALKFSVRDGDRVPRQYQAAIMGLASALAVAKGVYLPISFVACLLVLPRLADRRNQIIWGVAFMVLCLVPVWLWSRVVTAVYIPGRTDIPIDPAAQSLFVRAHPLTFLKVIATSLQAEYVGIYQWFVGVLSWGDTVLPAWFYWLYGCGLTACVTAESPGAFVVRWWPRVLLFGAAITTALLIILAQYLIWNSPGALTPIESLQGRYFIPAAILVVVSFPAIRRLRIPRSSLEIFASALAATSAVVCLVAVVRRFYIV
jgi:uncharacterized membrane protein